MKYINNLTFCKSKSKLDGVFDLADASRVQEVLNCSGEIDYTIDGFVNALNIPILSLNINGKITTLCNNCLKSICIDIVNDSEIGVFYNDDDLADAMFQSDKVNDGVLVENEFDILNFIEDEILMSLPYSIKHEECTGLNYVDEVENPFSILKK